MEIEEERGSDSLRSVCSQRESGRVRNEGGVNRWGRWIAVEECGVSLIEIAATLNIAG